MALGHSSRVVHGSSTWWVVHGVNCAESGGHLHRIVQYSNLVEGLSCDLQGRTSVALQSSVRQPQSSTADSMPPPLLPSSTMAAYA